MSHALPDGVHAACLTPLTRAGQVDHSRLAAYARGLLDAGCNGLGILGTTGEANCFSVRERQDLLERLVAAGLPPHRLLVGVGCCALPDTVALAAHALELGVKNLLVLPPFYYKDVREDGLLAVFDALLRQIGPAHPSLFLYHFPRMTGVPYTHAAIQRLIETFPEAIAGIKDSSGDVANMKAMIAAFPGFRVFAGTERYLLDVLRAGGAGCISATANLTASLAAQVYARHHTPEADLLQEHLTGIRASIETYPMIPALKHLTALATADAGWQTLRPPLVPLGQEERASLEASYQRARAAAGPS